MIFDAVELHADPVEFDAHRRTIMIAKRFQHLDRRSQLFAAFGPRNALDQANTKRVA
ncbi:MAG: hypothetical protein WDN76_11635 [Alphaproteobacteria bacterium]